MTWKLSIFNVLQVEQNSDEILSGADAADVAFLVVGDPYGATTHSDLALRAVEKGIKVKAIHNASIMNAVGCVGLQLYNYGETVRVQDSLTFHLLFSHDSSDRYPYLSGPTAGSPRASTTRSP